MEIEQLDHFTINVSDLEASTRFYTEIVGLTNGARPDFGFGGAWLYCGDRPVVHLIDIKDRRAFNGEETNGADITGAGALDHVAFRATGLADMQQRLRDLDVEFDERTVPGQGLRQVFLNDPDGVRLEFNFPASEDRD